MRRLISWTRLIGHGEKGGVRTEGNDGSSIGCLLSEGIGVDISIMVLSLPLLLLVKMKLLLGLSTIRVVSIHRWLGLYECRR